MSLKTEDQQDTKQVAGGYEGKYLTFVLGQEEYGLEILKVREIIGVMEINNLQQLIAAGQESALANRLQQIDQAKHIMNTILVDKEEKYERVTANVNGIKDLLEFLKDVLSSVSGIPKVKLFGEQSKGIGAGAVGNIRMYYDGISDQQDSDLRPHLEQLVSLLTQSKDFKSKYSKFPENWRLHFNELWKLTSKEIEEERLSTAKRDQIYLENGVLHPEEVAQSRFGGETYSTDTNLLDKGNTMRTELEISPQAGKNQEREEDTAPATEENED